MSEVPGNENAVITAEQDRLKKTLLSMTEGKPVGSPERIALADTYAYILSKQDVQRLKEEAELTNNGPLVVGAYTAALVSFNQVKKDMIHRAAAIPGYATAHDQINEVVSDSYLAIHLEGKADPRNALYAVGKCLEDTSRTLKQYVGYGAAS